MEKLYKAIIHSKTLLLRNIVIVNIRERELINILFQTLIYLILKNTKVNKIY